MGFVTLHQRSAKRQNVIPNQNATILTKSGDPCAPGMHSIGGVDDGDDVGGLTT